MDIQVRYVVNEDEFARVTFLYAEKKPVMLYSVGFINLLAWILLVILVIKVFLIGLTLQEMILGLGVSAWLFLRKPILKWLFKRKMKQINTIGKTLVIDISRNGIVWSGEGIQTGNLAWQYIKYIIQVKNGLIIPYSVNRFLWIPHSGFKSKLQIDKVNALIKDKQVPLRVYTKIAC